MTSFLNIVILFSVLVNLLVIYLCKDITFFSRHMTADNERILSYVKNFSLKKWPSSFRKEGSRIECREFWFLALYLISKLFKDPQKEIVNVSVCLLSNTINTILIYLIISKIFTNEIAFICSMLYLFSFWPYQVSIYFGHIVYSTMWFLTSVLAIAYINFENVYSIFILSFLAGVTCFICFASSSSSRKYPPIIFLFLFVTLGSYIEFPRNMAEYITPLGIFLFSILVFEFTSKFLSKKIINFFIQKEYTKRNNFKDHTRRMKEFLFYSKILISFFIIFSVFFSNNLIFFLSISTFVLGAFLISLYVLLPDFIKSLITYVSFLNLSNWGSHFLQYPKGFFGPKEDHKIKNAGLVWLPKFFFRISPIIFVTFLFSVFYILFNINNNLLFYSFCLIFILFPIFVSEITSSLKVGKAYFPCFIGFILAIACSSDLLLKNYSFNYVLYLIVFLNLALNSYLFFKDILPSRLFQVKLKNFLKRNKIQKFSTYNTVYNNSTLTPMLDSFKNFDVEYVDSIKNAKNNIFIIPPLSSKAVFMETEKEAIKHGDFKSDNFLNTLVKKNILKNFIEKEFKTLGSSRIWVVESEVTGFRDLNLNDVKDYDRWLGKCRVINLKKLKEINFAI